MESKIDHLEKTLSNMQSLLTSFVANQVTHKSMNNDTNLYDSLTSNMREIYVRREVLENQPNEVSTNDELINILESDDDNNAVEVSTITQQNETQHNSGQQNIPNKYKHITKSFKNGTRVVSMLQKGSEIFSVFTFSGTSMIYPMHTNWANIMVICVIKMEKH